MNEISTIMWLCVVFRKRFTDVDNQKVLKKLSMEMKNLDPKIPQMQVRGESHSIGIAFPDRYTLHKNWWDRSFPWVSISLVAMSAEALVGRGG